MVEIMEGETYVNVVSPFKWADEEALEAEINRVLSIEIESGSELSQIHAESHYILLEFFRPLITLEEFNSREWTPKELLEIYLGLDQPVQTLYKAVQLLGVNAADRFITEKIREVLQDG